MSANETAAPTPVAEVQPVVSKQRAIAATVTSTVVAVALSAGASFLINKVQVRVHNAINPPTVLVETTEL
jgi:hypothetical protein